MKGEGRRKENGGEEGNKEEGREGRGKKQMEQEKERQRRGKEKGKGRKGKREKKRKGKKPIVIIIPIILTLRTHTQTFKKGFIGPGKMARWLKLLPHKHENSSSDPQSSHNSGSPLSIPASESGEEGSPEQAK